MPFQMRYLYTAAMDVDPDRQELLEEVYDTEHIPALLKVPGVLSVARFKRQELTMIMGGERLSIVLDDEPLNSALYEIESPEVLTSEAWAKAVDTGRWPEQVRPYTSNRRAVLKRMMFPT